MRVRYFIRLLILLFSNYATSQDFSWPENKKVAISLTFDDARESQVLVGTDLLDQFNIKATFFVVPSAVEKQLERWRKAVASGHEIGNHSMIHPCSGNFAWSRAKALEDYTIEKMRMELIGCNRRIQELLNVKAEVFAYPCGQKYVGRGTKTKSYVPLVATLFIAGRGWRDESPNDPVHGNFAQLTGVEMDGKDFEEIRVIIEEARKTNQWLVLAGHEMGQAGKQTTRLEMLKRLAQYVQDPANEVWIAPMGTVARYLQTRGAKQ